jgi:hypothetical protein
LSDHIGHRGVVTSLAVNQAQGLVASGGSDGVIRVWSTASAAPGQFVLRHPAGPISALELSADGDWLVSAGPSSARIWQLVTGTSVGEIEVGGAPLAVAFARDSSLVAVGDSAGNIFLTTPGRADGLLAVRGRSPITALGFGRDSTRLVSGGRDGHVVLWDTLTAAPLGGARFFPDPVRWVDLADDGETVFVVSGAWLHRIEGAATPEPAIVQSRLLPEALRDARAFARRPDGYLFGIGLAGGGRLAPAEIDLDGDVATVPREIAARDWDRVLGLALDPATGDVRAPGP